MIGSSFFPHPPWDESKHAQPVFHRPLSHNPRRHEIIYSMDTGGNERTQLYRLHGVGGDTDHGLGNGWVDVDITREPKAIHTFGGWSHDGEQIVCSANREDPSRFDIYVQKVASGANATQLAEARLLQKGPGG